MDEVYESIRCKWYIIQRQSSPQENGNKAIQVYLIQWYIFFAHAIVFTLSATANLASVLLRTSSMSTPGASSVRVKPPPLRSTWNTH